jgi:hypothetical protein
VFRGHKGQRNRRDFVGPKNGVEVNHPKRESNGTTNEKKTK